MTGQGDPRRRVYLSSSRVIIVHPQPSLFHKMLLWVVLTANAEGRRQPSGNCPPVNFARGPRESAARERRVRARRAGTRRSGAARQRVRMAALRCRTRLERPYGCTCMPFEKCRTRSEASASQQQPPGVTPRGHVEGSARPREEKS